MLGTEGRCVGGPAWRSQGLLGRQRASLGGRGGGGRQSQMLPQLWTGVHLGQSNALEYLWHSGVRERHRAPQVESLSLYCFSFLASGGMSELRASPDCHWPQSVHVWDQRLFSSVLQQTGGGCTGSGRQRFSRSGTWPQDGAGSSARKPKQKGCPIRCAFQIKNRHYFSISMSHARFGIYLC